MLPAKSKAFGRARQNAGGFCRVPLSYVGLIDELYQKFEILSKLEEQNDPASGPD